MDKQSFNLHVCDAGHGSIRLLGGERTWTGSVILFTFHRLFKLVYHWGANALHVVLHTYRISGQKEKDGPGNEKFESWG
eukprot:1584729-Amphidinium_carterae.1